MTTEEKIESIYEHSKEIEQECYNAITDAACFECYGSVFRIMFDCKTGEVWRDEFNNSNSYKVYHDEDVELITSYDTFDIFDVVTVDEFKDSMDEDMLDEFNQIAKKVFGNDYDPADMSEREFNIVLEECDPRLSLKIYHILDIVADSLLEYEDLSTHVEIGVDRLREREWKR